MWHALGSQCCEVPLVQHQARHHHAEVANTMPKMGSLLPEGMDTVMGLGLRHALIQKGLQRHVEAPQDTAYSPPSAKRTCTTRKITRRTRASLDSPMHMPGA